jgi:chromosome segregation ATPase
LQKENLLNQSKDSLSYLNELTNRKHLIERDIYNYRDKFNKGEKNKSDNEIVETSSRKRFDQISKELSVNCKKMNTLQQKIDEIMSTIKKNKELVTFEKESNHNLHQSNETLDKKFVIIKESLKVDEAKLTNLRQEIDELKEHIEEADSERRNLNENMQKLIDNMSIINETNLKINQMLKIVYDSVEKRLKLLTKDKNFIQQSTELKGNLISVIKQVIDYKDLI